MAQKQRSRACLLGLLAALAVAPGLAQQTGDAQQTGGAPEGTVAAVPSPAQAGAPEPIEVREVLPRIATVDLVTEPEDIWERLRNGFSMPNLDSPLVAQQQAWYLSHPQTLARILERSRRYLFHIVEEIEKRGLPTELALLPMVESAYNPMALSPARASGLWQFIPETGRNYNLRQNWWVDERRDIISSTSAALDYLRDIYEMNGDWHLALASYNWGENAVARAIERNRAKGLPSDYPNLPMPAETRNYVPKLQALKNIVARPQLFGVVLDPIPNRPYFVTVEKPADMDIAVAAHLAEVPIEEFRALNPAYNRPVANGESRLVLPADKAEIFRTNLARHDKPLVTWQTYTLRKGDRLERISRAFGITLARLREVNGITPRMKLGSGHSVLVPARNPMSVSDTLAVNLPPARVESPARPRKAVKTAANSIRRAVAALRTARRSRPVVVRAHPVRPQAKSSHSILALKSAGRRASGS